MDIAAIDQWANNGTSPLHAASALGKGLAATFVLAAVIVSWSPYLLLSIYLVLLAGVLVSRLPFRSVAGIAAYPTIFAALFALSRLDGTWTTPAVILLKSLTAAQVMVLLIATTPYPDVFAAIGRFLPRIVADGLFITYNSVFLLLDQFDHMLTAQRLRGGMSRRRPIASGVNLARSLGMLLIHAIDLAERLYEIMRVRGYRGRIVATSRWRAISERDVPPMAAALVLLAVALAALFQPRFYAAFGGYLLIFSAATPLVALAITPRSPRPAPLSLPVVPFTHQLEGRQLEEHQHTEDEAPSGLLTNPTSRDSAGRPEVARVSCVRHVYPDGTEVSLCGLDFVAHAGEGIVILGPNGAGKSTLLYHLLGLLRPDEGVVTVLGHDPAREFNLIQPRLGVLVQNVDEQLIGPTVADDVAFGARNAGYSSTEVAARTTRSLQRLGIEHLAGKVVHYLSGGEKRKVTLAGALVTDPEILILDEPFEGLDPRSRSELVRLLCELRAEKGLTLIVTTHDVDLVPALADTVYVLAEGGHIIARGTPEEVFRRREILEISNIEAPALTILFHRLHEVGLDLGTPTDLDDATNRLVAAVRAGRLTSSDERGLEPED